VRPRGIFLIAKKELMDKIRNRWILALSLLFVVISLTLAYLGGGQMGLGLGFRDFRATVPALSPVMAVLVPLVALILGYATIAGEDESGSLHLLLSLAVTRTEVLLGKFLGLGAVILATVLVGMSVTGIVIAAAAGTEHGAGYLGFMGITVLAGLVFLSLSLLLSSLAKRRSTAIGGAVFLFFFFLVIFDLLVLGLMIAAGWEFSLDPSSIQDVPGWAWVLLLADPLETASLAGYMAVGTTQAFGYSVVAPPFMTMPLLVFVLLLWMAVPLLLSFVVFHRRDI